MTGRKEVLQAITKAITDLIDTEVQREMRERLSGFLGLKPARKPIKVTVAAKPAPKPKRPATKDEKLKVVALSKKIGVAKAARQNNVSSSSIYLWQKGKALDPTGSKNGKPVQATAA